MTILRNKFVRKMWCENEHSREQEKKNNFENYRKNGTGKATLEILITKWSKLNWKLSHTHSRCVCSKRTRNFLLNATKVIHVYLINDDLQTLMSRQNTPRCLCGECIWNATMKNSRSSYSFFVCVKKKQQTVKTIMNELWVVRNKHLPIEKQQFLN